MLQSHVQLRHAMKMHMMVSKKKKKKKNDLAHPCGPYSPPLSDPSRPFARSLARIHSPPPSSSSISLTRHYEATSASHAQTGSAPPQKSDSRRPGATAPPRGPARPQDRRCHPPYPCRRRRRRRRQHRRCPDRLRPTSVPREAGQEAAGPDARRVRFQTPWVEAAAEVAAVAAVVATPEVVIVVMEAAVAATATAVAVEARVPREMRRR